MPFSSNVDGDMVNKKKLRTLRLNGRRNNLFNFIKTIVALLIIMTIHDVIEKFQRKLVITKRPATVQYYQFYFGLMRKYLGNLAIASINEDVVLEFIVSLKTNHPTMKNITINKALSALKTTLKYGGNYTIQFMRLSESKTLIPLIPFTTINRLLVAMKVDLKRPVHLRNFLIVKILLETGLRMNELIHLEKKHIDFSTQTMLVAMTKTHAHRIVCFRQETEQDLQTLLALHPHVPYVFYNLTTLKRMTTASIESLFYQLKKRYGIQDNITPHKWRHTFATSFLRKGGDLETLRMLLGHSNLKTTQKYLHFNQQDIRTTYQAIMNKEK
jgi:integrase/recombinase XerD